MLTSLRDEIAALRQAGQEPVAWRHLMEHGHSITSIPAVARIWRDQGLTVEPLYTAPPPVVPVGYKLVPLEPTPEMQRKATGPASSHGYGSVSQGAACAICRAMLAAAPNGP